MFSLVIFVDGSNLASNFLIQEFEGIGSPCILERITEALNHFYKEFYHSTRLQFLIDNARTATDLNYHHS